MEGFAVCCAHNGAANASASRKVATLSRHRGIALHEADQPTPLDHIRRIIIFVVNSLSIPSTKWNKSETPPGTIDVLVKSAGVPIDRYSGEMVEPLKDIDARWRTLRQIRESGAFAKEGGPPTTEILNAPDADIYVVDVSFKALQDKFERASIVSLSVRLHPVTNALFGSSQHFNAVCCITRAYSMLMGA